MSGGGFFSGSRGGRKKIDNNLNLVPFIDMFSMLIMFLLSTAVWDQLAAVQVNLGAEDKPSVETPKQDIKKVTSNVRISVGNDGIETFDEGKIQRYPRQEGVAFDYTPIEAFVADVRQRYTDKKDMLIFASDAATYEDLVAVMDRCLAQDFLELIVTGADQKM